MDAAQALFEVIAEIDMTAIKEKWRNGDSAYPRRNLDDAEELVDFVRLKDGLDEGEWQTVIRDLCWQAQELVTEVDLARGEVVAGEHHIINMQAEVEECGRIIRDLEDQLSQAHAEIALLEAENESYACKADVLGR